MNDRHNNNVQGDPGGVGAATDLFSDAWARVEGGLLRSSSQIADQASDSLIGPAEAARVQGAPVFDRLTHRAESRQRRGVTAMPGDSPPLHDQAPQAADAIPYRVRRKAVGLSLFSATPGGAVELLLQFLGQVWKSRD